MHAAAAACDVDGPDSPTQMYLCSSCCKNLRKSSYSNVQFRRGRARRCTACVDVTRAAGMRGTVMLADHKASRGRIDGRRHKVRGKAVVDRSSRWSRDDLTIARAAIAKFKANFHLPTWAAPLQYNEGALALVQPQREFALPPEFATDFLTTVRSGFRHEAMKERPTQNPNEVWGVGMLEDAMSMSTLYELRFTCTAPAQFAISSMEATAVLRHASGTMLMDGDIPVAGRASGMLTEVACRELVLVYEELSSLRPYLPRGCKCASICR